MKISIHGPVVAGATLLVLLAACSVAEYRKPVSDFADATKNAEAALIGLDQQVTNAYAALHRRRALAGERLVQIKPGDCLVESTRCRLVVVDADREAQPLSPDPALSNMIRLMHEIRAYADGLSAIANADSAAKVVTHVNATIGSVENLAETVAKLGGEDIVSSVDLSEYATPAGQVVSWIFGQYVARAQLDGLERATKNARKVVTAAADLFGSAGDIASGVPRAALAEAVSKRIDAFRDKRSQENLDKLLEIAGKYDRFLVARPPIVFVQLGAAHEALVKKLQGNEITLANVMAKIKAFATEAETLAEIARDLAAADEMNEEA